MSESTFVQPLPIPNEDSRQYWEASQKDQFLVQRCKDCGRYRFPPQLMCPHCWSENTEWLESSGIGTVYTFGVVRRAIQPRWSDKIPYVVALVELNEGPKIFTNIMECEPEEVAIGMQVEVIFDHVTPDIALPKFRPIR